MSEASSPASDSVVFDSGSIAMDIALEEARNDPALRGTVEAYLQRQIKLAHIQEHHLLKQFSLSQWEKRLGVFLRLATAVVGVAVAVTLGTMVWDAAHSNGLIVESFGVPPDMAARGLSGQTVASQMLDKLTALQAATDSSRAPQSYANNWGGNLKVEIPDTGVSLGEVQRFLKEWLGHDTHISGEIYRTATGIAVTARAGAETGATFTGAENDLDALMQKAAEHVYGITQPYRYANYLDRDRTPAGLEDRSARAAAIYEKLVQSSDPNERAWALNGLGTLASGRRDTRAAVAYYVKSVEVQPDFSVGYFARAFQERFLDRRENELAAFRRASALQHANPADVNPQVLPTARGSADGQIAMLVGDFAEAERQAKIVADLRLNVANLNYRAAQVYALWAMARQHDAGAVRTYMREIGRTKLGANAFGLAVSTALEDWQAIPSQIQEAVAVTGRPIPQLLEETPFSVSAIALATAHLGNIKGAEALVAKSPADCDGCLLARAQIAEMEGQQTRADYWFARAEDHAPPIPFAYHEWGLALLARGKPDEAIAQFKLANQKGPHFADPLEGWGEALMAQNKSHLALGKFAQAEKYAPNWGRLHLKWAEALVYAGKRDEAQKQFARAAALALTPSEKSELVKASRP